MPETNQRVGYRNFKPPFSRILNVADDARAVKRALSHPNPAVFSTSLTISPPNADVTGPICFPSERQHERRPNATPGPVKKRVRFCLLCRLKQIHPHGRRTRWRLGGQPKMREDAGDGGRFFDGRDELELPTTVRAVLDVDTSKSF